MNPIIIELCLLNTCKYVITDVKSNPDLRYPDLRNHRFTGQEATEPTFHYTNLLLKYSLIVTVKLPKVIENLKITINIITAKL